MPAGGKVAFRHDLRLRYDIPLSELSAASGLSNHYIRRAELGEISPTENQFFHVHF